MSEQTAGFGPGSWLPRSVQLAWRQEAIAEAAGARRAAEELAARVERRRSEDMTYVAQQAEARGEPLDPIALATGRVTGRSLAETLEDARRASEAEDARAEAEARRTRGERLNLIGALEDPAARRRLVPDDEPGDRATRSAARARKRSMERRNDAFSASVEATQRAEQARAHLERQMPALRRPSRRTRSRETPEETYRRACAEIGAPVDGVRFR